MEQSPDNMITEFNEFITTATPVQRTIYIESCMNAFCASPVPTEAMVNEIVLLSYVMTDKEQFQLLVRGYMQKLRSMPVVADYHLSGYVRILVHSLTVREILKISENEWIPACDAFLRWWSDAELAHQTEKEIDAGLLSLSRLLVALEGSKITSSPDWIESKGSSLIDTLNQLVTNYQGKVAARVVYDNALPAWPLLLAQQAVLRLSGLLTNDEVSDKGIALGNRARQVLNILGSELLRADVLPSLASTIGMLPELINELASAEKSATSLQKWAKWVKWTNTGFERSTWYPELIELQADLQLAAWRSLQRSASNLNEPQLVTGLLILFSKADFWGGWQIQAGVCDVLETIARATQAQGSLERIGELGAAQVINVQQIALVGLVHIFRHSKKLKVRVIALDRLMVLLGSGGTLGKNALAVLSQLFPKDPIALPALSQGDVVFRSERQPLTLELAKGSISVVPLWLIELALMHGRETSAILVEELTEYIKYEGNKQSCAVSLLATQCLLRIQKCHGDLNIESTLAERLGTDYTKYLKGGEIYEYYSSLVSWLIATWEDVAARLTAAESEPRVLPLWQLYQTKPVTQSFDEHIKHRYTLVKVGEGGLLTDAKTESLMQQTLELAKESREPNPRVVPSTVPRSISVVHDYVATEVTNGGAMHLTSDDFFPNAARGLSVLANDSVPITPKRNLSSMRPSVAECQRGVEYQSNGMLLQGGIIYQQINTNTSALPPPRIRVGKLFDERLVNVRSHPKILAHRVITKGREALMAAIDKQLAQAGYQLSVLKGMGGVGKSILAREYALRCAAQQRYQLIYWLDAETPEQLQVSFEQMCKAFGLEGYLGSIDVVASVYATLGTLQSYLLVFDNVKSHDAIANYLPIAEATRGYLNQAHRSHCLITSRDRQGWLEVVEVSAFNSVSFAEYVNNFLSADYLGFQLADIEDESATREFGDALGYHPLALTQAACLIKRRAAKRFSSSKMSSLRDYLTALAKTPDFVLSSNEVLPQYMDKATDYPADVLKALQLSLQDFLSDVPDKNFACYLLQGLRYLHPTNIPDAWVLTMAKVFYAGQALSQAENAAELVLTRLTELSILEYDDSMHHHSGMHRLMHLALHAVQLDEDSPENQCGWQQAAQGLLASFPHVYYERTTESSTPWLTQLPYVLVAVEPSASSSEESLLAAQIRSRLAFYYVYHQRDLAQAKTYALAAVSHWETLYGRTHDASVREQLAEVYNTLGQIDAGHMMTDFAYSAPWLEKSVALYQDNLGLGFRISALSSVTAKRLYAEQWAYASVALMVYKWGLDWLDNSESRMANVNVSKCNFERAMLYRALGLAYSKDRKPELALSYYEKSKAILVELDNQTLLLELYNELSETYHALAQFSECQNMLQAAHDLVLAMYGGGSVDHIEGYCKLALDDKQMRLSAEDTILVRQLIEKHRLSWSDVTHNNQTLLMVMIQAGVLDVLKAFNLEAAKLSSGDSLGKTPLMQAAIWGQTNIVEYLLHKKVPVNTVDTQGTTALMCAALHGHLEVLNLLLTEGHADHHQKNQRGHLAFHYAIAGGHMLCVQRLFEVNSEVMITLEVEPTLMLAVHANQAKILQWLLTTYHTRFQSVSNNINNVDVFLLASFLGHLECAKVLYTNGIDVTAKNQRGCNALLNAVEGGHALMVDWLLDQPGVMLEDRDNQGMTPLLLAAQWGHLVLVKHLSKRGALLTAKDQGGGNALLHAVVGGHTLLVDWLLDQPGLTLEDRSNDGMTPLLVAAECGHLDVVQHLLQRGASLAAKDQWGRNALLNAVVGGNALMVDWLLEQPGVTLEYASNDGLTPLLVAAKWGHLDVVQHLLHRGALLTAKGQGGRNALLEATWGGHTAVVDWLLDQPGIMLEDRDKGGMTPLLVAAWRGHLDVAQHLLQRGALLTAKDEMGRNALHNALEGGHALFNGGWSHHAAVVDWLLGQTGVTLEDRDSDGLTPLLLAAKWGHLDVVQHLLRRGALLIAKDRWDRNALLLAAQGGHLPLMHWLLEKPEFSKHDRDANGCNCLLLAAQDGRTEAVKQLISEKLGTLNDKAHKGRGAVLLASTRVSIDNNRMYIKRVRTGLQWLFAQGLSVHERDDVGNTAILLAALEGSISQIDWLLSQGANLKDKNHFGRNVLLLAARMGHQPCVEWLITQGCSVLETDTAGNNVLMLAAKGGHLPLIQYLLEHTELSLTAKNIVGQTALDCALAAEQWVCAHWFHKHWPSSATRPELPDTSQLPSLTSRKTPSFLIAIRQTLCKQVREANSVTNEEDTLLPDSYTEFSLRTLQ